MLGTPRNKARRGFVHRSPQHGNSRVMKEKPSGRRPLGSRPQLCALLHGLDPPLPQDKLFIEGTDVKSSSSVSLTEGPFHKWPPLESPSTPPT